MLQRVYSERLSHLSRGGLLGVMHLVMVEARSAWTQGVGGGRLLRRKVYSDMHLLSNSGARAAGLKLVSEVGITGSLLMFGAEQADVEKCTTCGSLLNDTKYKCKISRGT